MSAQRQSGQQDCYCFAVRSAARRITQFYDRFLAPSGLRASQFSTLAKLKAKGPLTINELAKTMAMDRTTLGRNIRPLERDGLIETRQVDSDRRAKALHLTRSGEKRLREAVQAWAEAQEAFEKSFGVERSGELRALLHSAVEKSAGDERST